MKKKSIVILVFMVLLAIALNYVAFFGFNVSGFSYGGMLDPEKGIRKGIDLAGGSVITFQADAQTRQRNKWMSLNLFSQPVLTAQATQRRE